MQSLLYSIETLTEITHNFTKELEKADNGHKTSLFYHKTPLPKNSLINQDIVQVIAIGGSFYTSARVSKTATSFVILDFKNGNLPIFTTKKVFCDFFETLLDSSVHYVGLNFAYPLKTVVRDEHLDGILSDATKEHRFDNLIGHTVGEELEECILKKTGRKITVSVGNDIICLLLAGMKDHTAQPLVAGVLGTGLNFALLQNHSTLINLESGNFDIFPQSFSGQEIDKASSSPHTYLFEKETSGAYLYKHFNIITKKLNPSYPQLNSTKELDSLSTKKTPEGKLAQDILEHSAQLVACQIAGIYQYMHKKKLTLIMEGSLFWKGQNYKNLVQKYIRLLGVDLQNIQFVHIKNSNIVGAAQLFSYDS